MRETVFTHFLTQKFTHLSIYYINVFLIGGGAAHNGDGDNKDVSDDEQMDQGTKPIYGSDAENDDDMSDHEGEGPTNAPVDSDPAPAAPAPPAEAAVAN